MHVFANFLAAIAALLILLDIILWFGTGPNGYRRHVLLQFGCLLLAIAVAIGATGFVPA